MAKQTFSDFSGGITDFRFNTASNYSEIMDNFSVLRDKSMEVRYGNRFLDIAASRLPTNERASAIREIDETEIYFSNGGVYYIDSGFQSLLGPTGNKPFHLADVDTMADAARFGDQYICVDDDYSFPQKIFKDENTDLRCINAGLPRVVSDPVLTPSALADLAYSYAFVYTYDYRVGTTLFTDKGEPLYVSLADGPDFNSGTVDITDYLELTSGVFRNYDVTNIKKEIYRTKGNGTTYYKVAEIDNNVLVYTDSTSDETLETGAVLYTQGGVQPNHQPPRCKYITSNNNIVYYANVIESAETKPFRLRFSKEGDPDSVPDTFFEDFEADITGIAAIDDRTVVFTEDKAVALGGLLDDLGRGTIARKTIADVGCISNSSIVTTQDHIYWFSEGKTAPTASPKRRKWGTGTSKHIKM